MSGIGQIIGGIGSMAQTVLPMQQFKQAQTAAGNINQFGSTQSQDIINAYNAQAQAQGFNAQIAQQNAQLATQAASSNALTQQRQNLLNMGALQAQMASNGGQIGTGTNLALVGEQAQQGQLEVDKALYAGQVQAANYTDQANQALFAANMSQYTGQVSAQTAKYNAAVRAYSLEQQAAGQAAKSGGTLLTGAGTSLSKLFEGS